MGCLLCRIGVDPHQQQQGYEMLVALSLARVHSNMQTVAVLRDTSHVLPHAYCLLCRFSVEPNQQQQGYEMLVRKLLKLPHRPAIIIVHWWGPRHDCNHLISQSEARARTELRHDHRCAMTLWNSTEDRIQTIVQHYGVQVRDLVLVVV